MAIGALLNQMASLTSSLSGIGGMMATLGSAAGTIGSALAGAFSKAFNAAKDAFGKIKDFVMEHIWPMLEPVHEAGKTVFSGVLDIAKTAFGVLRGIFDNIVLPIFGVLKDTAEIFFNFFTGDWTKAMENAKELVLGKIVPVFQKLMSLPGKLLATGIGKGRELLGKLTSFAESTVGKLIDGVINGFKRAGSFISGIFGKIFGGIKKVYDATIGKAVKAIGKVFGAVGKKLGFGKGGGDSSGASATNVGTAVAGGMQQTFNITMEISGITDATDKRKLAREIGDMLQAEMRRKVFTNTFGR